MPETCSYRHFDDYSYWTCQEDAGAVISQEVLMGYGGDIVMRNTTLDRSTIGFVLSAALGNIINVLLVIFKELSPSFMKIMAALTGHHWITHGVIVVGLFLLLGFTFSGTVKPDSWSAEKLSRIILWSIIIGGSSLAAFYLLH